MDQTKNSVPSLQILCTESFRADTKIMFVAKSFWLSGKKSKVITFWEWQSQSLIRFCFTRVVELWFQIHFGINKNVMSDWCKNNSLCEVIGGMKNTLTIFARFNELFVSCFEYYYYYYSIFHNTFTKISHYNRLNWKNRKYIEFLIGNFCRASAATDFQWRSHHSIRLWIASKSRMTTGSLTVLTTSTLEIAYDSGG